LSTSGCALVERSYGVRGKASLDCSCSVGCREQKRLGEQERQRQKDVQEVRNSKVKPLIKVTA
jgi:hypothetical protein